MQSIERKGRHLGLEPICTHQRERARWTYEHITMAHVSVEPVLYMFDVCTSVVFSLLFLIFSRWYHLCGYQWSCWERVGGAYFPNALRVCEKNTSLIWKLLGLLNVILTTLLERCSHGWQTTETSQFYNCTAVITSKLL